MHDKPRHSTSLEGRRAERRAAAFLRAQGYRLVGANYRAPGGEIDLIALEGECLVFVEVKARRSHRFGTPEEAITATKRRRLLAAARHYLSEHPWAGDVRFDVVALDGARLRLHRNAWEV